MGDLISRSRLKAELDAWAKIEVNPQYYHKEDADFVIDSQAAVDAVEVVRCKDCYSLGWRGTNTNDCGYFYCRHPSGLKVIKNAHTSYCDFGERKKK